MDLNNVSTWSVLIVDDEPDNLEVIADTLDFFGAVGKTALNGEEGLVVLENFMPDFILLDLSMPRMNGWEMRKAVKTRPETQHIPIIALTAHAMAGDAERALEVGFDGYITKPVEILSFVESLRKILQPYFEKTVTAPQKQNGAGKEETKP